MKGSDFKKVTSWHATYNIQTFMDDSVTVYFLIEKENNEFTLTIYQKLRRNKKDVWEKYEFKSFTECVNEVNHFIEIQKIYWAKLDEEIEKETRLLEGWKE